MASTASIMGRVITSVFCCVLATHFFISPSTGQVGSQKRELVILSWGDYMDPVLVEQFESRFNAKVRWVYYETDELKDDMLVESDGKGFDIVVSGSPSITSYIKRKWLTPLSESDIPNMKHIDARWLQAQPQIAGYAVPYLWGTLGIAYRSDLIPDTVKSWKQLFAPAEYLRQKIVMIKDSRETLGMALKSLGYPLNSVDPAHYDEVERLLRAQRPYVKDYSYISWKEDSLLITGEILMAMMYNGDVLTLRDKGAKHVEYIVPEEGTVLWVDYLVIMESSKQKQLAMDYINFVHDPQNSARLSTTLHYATPNKAAEKLLPEDILGNPIIYPDKATLDRSEFFGELPPRIVKKRNEIFSRVIQ